MGVGLSPLVGLFPRPTLPLKSSHVNSLILSSSNIMFLPPDTVPCRIILDVSFDVASCRTFPFLTVDRRSSTRPMVRPTEMKMCRWACGHTLRDHVRNDNIEEGLKVESNTERCGKARLRWFGHVKRRDHDYVGRKTLEVVPPVPRKRGRPKQRWMYYANRDMRAIGTRKDEVHDRNGWRRIVSAAATSQLGERTLYSTSS